MKPEFLKPEVTFRTARSSGAGGQHVNKVETKVELRFDVAGSSMLEENQKQLVMSRLASRITKDGVLIMSNQESRSQLKNKENVLEEFYSLMEEALKPPKKRKKVKPLAADPEQRKQEKCRQSEKKSLRQKVTLPKESDLYI